MDLTTRASIDRHQPGGVRFHGVQPIAVERPINAIVVRTEAWWQALVASYVAQVTG